MSTTDLPPANPFRIYNLADQVVALPVVTKVVASEPLGLCALIPATPGAVQQRADAFVCTRMVGEDPDGPGSVEVVVRTPSCASCLGRLVSAALENGQAVWVEVPGVVVP